MKAKRNTRWWKTPANRGGSQVENLSVSFRKGRKSKVQKKPVCRCSSIDKSEGQASADQGESLAEQAMAQKNLATKRLVELFF